MPTDRYTITSDWPATPTVTASADTAILITNETPHTLRYWITDSDTPPSTPAYLGHPVQPGRTIAGTTFASGLNTERGPTLKTGERLWLALPGGPGDITMTTGAA